MVDIVEKQSRNLQQFFTPLLVIVAIALAFFGGSMWQKVQNLQGGKTKTTTTDTTQQQGTTQGAVSLATIKGLYEKDVVKFGDANKKVIFVEISDPSCPFCQAAGGLNPELNRQIDPTNNRFKLTTDGGSYQAPVPQMRKLVDSGKAGFIFIYSPGHGNGEMGTKALYCANEKGKYWAVNDLLMTNAGYNLLNNTVKNDKAQAGTLADFLKKAVDVDFMKSCLESDKYNARLQADTQLAQTLGYQGTPDFFVNDKNFAGAYNYTDIKSTVDAALK